MIDKTKGFFAMACAAVLVYLMFELFEEYAPPHIVQDFKEALNRVLGGTP